MNLQLGWNPSDYYLEIGAYNDSPLFGLHSSVYFPGTSRESFILFCKNSYINLLNKETVKFQAENCPKITLSILNSFPQVEILFEKKNQYDSCTLFIKDIFEFVKLVNNGFET
jgi:hypothetical protein